jgi:hypothetical protein
VKTPPSTAAVPRPFYQHDTCKVTPETNTRKRAHIHRDRCGPGQVRYAVPFSGKCPSDERSRILCGQDAPSAVAFAGTGFPVAAAMSGVEAEGLAMSHPATGQLDETNSLLLYTGL